MSITAMKQALEALGRCTKYEQRDYDAMDALRAAISEHEKCEPVAWRWSERGFWFSWTTDFTHHDKALRLNCPVEYAYTHPAPVDQCDHVPVTTFGGDYCIKCDAPVEKCEPVAWLDITENRPVELLLGEQVQAAKEGGAGHWLKQRLRPLYTHPAPVPAGWQLVPVEPTEAMKVAGSDALGVYHCGSPSDIYKVMLQAAPKPGESHD